MFDFHFQGYEASMLEQYVSQARQSAFYLSQDNHPHHALELQPPTLLIHKQSSGYKSAV